MKLLRLSAILIAATMMMAKSALAALPAGQAPAGIPNKGDDAASKFVRAAAAGDVDAVKKSLADGIDVNVRVGPGLSAVQAAKIHGQTEIYDLLVAKGADVSAPPPPPEKILDAMISERTKGVSPAVAVLIARDGKILFQKAYGMANLEHRVPASIDTRFRIGSITKQFTSAAILKLVEEGKLSLDDSLSKFIGDFPNGDKVAIHHLLTHTSGIHSYTSKPDFMKKARTYVSPDDLIAEIKSDPFDFQPGNSFLYNNSGYFLLGRIIEKVSGKSYGDFLKERFFEPLGMKHTGVHAWSDILENEAHGYSFVDGKMQKAENWDMSRAGGAGNLYSTVGDLHLWNEAVFHGKVLSEATLAKAFTPVRTEADSKDDKKDVGYGFGWSIGTIRGLREIAHGGGLNGFNSYLLRIPDQRFTAAVLVNALPPPSGLSAAAIAQHAANLYLWEKMATRPVYAVKADVSEKALDDYVGRYDYGSAVMTVTRKGKSLFAQLTGQPAFEIFPKAEDEFFWKVVDAQVKFERDDKKNVVKAVHRQGGQTINAPRIPNFAEVKVDPAILDGYVGKYSLLGGVLDVTRDGQRMFAQLTGQPRFEIFAASDHEFFYKVVHAKLSFKKNPAGKVEKITLEQGGARFEGQPRKE